MQCKLAKVGNQYLLAQFGPAALTLGASLSKYALVQLLHLLCQALTLLHRKPIFGQYSLEALFMQATTIDTYSLVSMNDAVCIYRRRLHEKSLQGVLTEDWFAVHYRERWAEQM